MFKNKQLFQCEPGRGMFVPLQNCQLRKKQEDTKGLLTALTNKNNCNLSTFS